MSQNKYTYSSIHDLESAFNERLQEKLKQLADSIRLEDYDKLIKDYDKEKDMATAAKAKAVVEDHKQTTFYGKIHHMANEENGETYEYSKEIARQAIEHANAYLKKTYGVTPAGNSIVKVELVVS